jgi:hypothetical protein
VPDEDIPDEVIENSDVIDAIYDFTTFVTEQKTRVPSVEMNLENLKKEIDKGEEGFFGGIFPYELTAEQKQLLKQTFNEKPETLRTSLAITEKLPPEGERVVREEPTAETKPTEPTEGRKETPSEELLEGDRDYNMAQDNPDDMLGIVNYSPDVFSFVADIPKQTKKLWQKYFKKEGDLPKSVFGLQVKMTGERSALSNNISFNIKKFKQAIREEYKGKIKPEMIVKFNNVLSGQVPYSEIEPKTAETIKKTRTDIDRLSKLMIDDGIVEGQLLGTIQKNLGTYMNRSYRVHDVPNWAEKVPFEIMNRAKSFIRNAYAERGEELLAEIPKILERTTQNVLAKTRKSYRLEELQGTKDIKISILKKNVEKLVKEFDENIAELNRGIKEITDKIETRKSNIKQTSFNIEQIEKLDRLRIKKEKARDILQEKQNEELNITKDVISQLEQRDITQEVEQAKQDIDKIFAKAEERISLLEEKGKEKINLSDEDLNGIMQELLHKFDENTPLKILAGGKLDSKDLSILKKRGDIAPEIRALWGEYNDPLVNYAKSVVRMADLIAKSRFLQDVRKEGLGKFLFEKPTETHYKEIATEGTKSMGPLNGLYTTPEIKQAFEELNNKEQYGNALGLYMKVNGFVKYSKTVLSFPITHVRNFIANPWIMLRNGNVMFGKVPISVRTIFGELTSGGSEKTRAYIEKLKGLGVLDSGIHAEELKATINDANKNMGDFESMTDGTIKRIFRTTGKVLKKLYEGEDAVYKIYSFEAERAKYKEAFPEWSDKELDKKAAQLTRGTVPTWGEMPKAIQMLRRFPITGTFVSFPYEMIRTTINAIDIGLKEIKDPRTRTIGAKRLAGTITAIGAVSAASLFSKMVNNINKDDEDGIRRFLAPWMINSELFFLKNDRKGEYQILDLSQTDPHNYFKKPLIAILNGEDVKESAITSFKEFFNPFLSEELLLSKILDINRNKTAYGKQVYNEQDPVGNQISDMYAHIAQAIEPGSLRSFKKIGKGMMGQLDERTGKPINWKLESVNQITGQRIYTLNILQSAQFKFAKVDDDIKEARRIYNTVFYAKGSTDEQKKDAYDRANEAIKKTILEAKQDYDAAIKLGCKQEDMDKVLKGVRLNNKQKSYIGNDKSKDEWDKVDFVKTETEHGGGSVKKGVFKLSKKGPQKR